MAQLAVSAAGAAIGFSIGGPVGAQIGWTAGAIIGSSLFPEKGKAPGVGDLKAPGVQYGTQLVRLHGTNRTAGALAWYSPKRIIAGDSGGKGTPEAATGDTAEIDLLYIVSVDSDIHSLLRVWINGELKWTARADSDDASLENSAATDAWTSIEFLDGAVTQLPHPVIEAIEGVGNAPAYRHRQCVLIEGLQLGQSGQIPLVEFEVSKAVTETEDLILYAPFTADNVDTIAPATTTITSGPGVGSNTAAGVTISWDEATIVQTSLRFYDFDLTPDKLDLSLYAGQDVSIEVRATFVDTLIGGTNEFRFFEYSNGTYQVGFGWYSGALRCTYSDGSSDNTSVTFAGQERFKIVFLANGTTAEWYMDDVLVRSRSVSRAAIALGDLYIRISDNCRIKSGTFKNLRMYVGALPTTPPLIDLADIVRAEWALVDDVANIDADDLEGTTVRGFQAGGSIRSALEMLSAIFHFGAVCSDLLYFRPRGGAIAATVDADDLAAGEEAPGAEPFAPVVADDSEIPERVALTYPNYSDDYANGTETGNRGGAGTVVLAQQSNVVMTPAEAKAAAETYVAQLGVAATTARISLSCAYAELEPTDPISVPDQDGNVYRMRIARDTYAAGVHAFDLVLDDATSLVGLGITAEDYTPNVTVPAPDETTIVLLDIPILRDVDDDPGFYAVAKGSAHGSTLYSSLDDVNYVEEVAIPTQSVFGVCNTTLPDWTGPRVFDEVSSLTVNVGDGTLSSSTRAALLGDQSINACAIGVDGRWELCQFRTATLVSPGVYTLTGWLRGGRGTEWASVDHVANEKFVMLTAAGARRVAMQQSEIGVAEYWKGVSAGRLLSSATGELFTDNGIGQKPFAPVDLRKAGDDSAVVVTWKRRTRLAPRFCGAGGINVPLGEASESYDVELRDAGDVLVSSETVTSAEWSGGSALRVGSLGAPAWGLKTIGGELVGIRDDLPGQYLLPRYLIRFNTSGVVVAQSPALGDEVYQWANSGDELYAATASINTTATPAYYTSGKVQRVTRTALGTIAATYTAATPGDVAGVACDGTSVWITERYGGNLRKLNATTLASVATYPLDVGMEALLHDAGSLWILASATSEVIEWDIATTTELQRFAVVEQPFDLLIVGSVIFVHGRYEVGAYDMSTGSPVATHEVTPPYTLAQRSLAHFDATYVTAAGIDEVTLIDDATAALYRVVDPASSYFYNVAGSYGSTLYLTTGEPSFNKITYGYELTSGGLAGYSLTVYQNSANLGRGYPATLEL